MHGSDVPWHHTGDPERKLTPDELIKTLQIEMKTCRVRTKDTASTMNSYTSKPIPNPYPNPIPIPNPNHPPSLALFLKGRGAPGRLARAQREARLHQGDAHAPLALEAARQPARRRGHLAGPARAHARLALLMTAVWIMDHLIESRTAAK